MKKIISIMMLLTICLLLFGCAEDESKKKEMYVYYLNADGNALIQEVYPMMDIEETIDVLKTHSVIGGSVKLDEYKVMSNRLELYFDTDYFTLEKSKEVLSRAAIVQTLTQLAGVDFVSFYIGKDPLMDSRGHALGLMSKEDFVQNTGSSIESYKEIDLVLYFADKDGKKLKQDEKKGVRYNVNTSIERLVIEQLIKGTNSSGVQPTVPSNTTILGVSVREGICYVNLDEKFVTESYDLNPEVAIYSIVNSVIANGNVTQVQILIEGANDVMYKNSVDLSRPLKMKE